MQDSFLTEFIISFPLQCENISTLQKRIYFYSLLTYQELLNIPLYNAAYTMAFTIDVSRVGKSLKRKL
jgi:hypothetical protein